MTEEPTAGPHGKAQPAISWPATRAAVRRQSVLPWLLLIAGLACLPLSLVLIDIQDRAPSEGARAAIGVSANLSAAVFTVGIIFGGGYGWIRRRRRKALRRYPWVRWPINYISTGRNEWVELLDANGQPVSGLILSTWAKDIGKLVNQSTTEVWFAGDPQKYGVISRPGGGDLRYAYRAKSRPPPRFTFRDREPDGHPRTTGGTNGATNNFEMHRENGKVVMKPPDGRPETRHGALGDSRYPSPRGMRRTIAFLVDWLLHVGCAIGGGVAVSPDFSTAAVRSLDWRHVGVNLVAMVGFWLAASAADRVLVQSIFHTTLGKAIFGLVVIRPDNGRFPSFGKLLGVWLVDFYLAIALPIGLLTFSNLPGPDNLEDYFLPAVRRRDVKGEDGMRGQTSQLVRR
ncbi:RDD family protein [Nocardia transvalensis]|uniref:RDD family protein n=1 Tax=Nocardia transvalensis TaxID=37333 RepID=UPI001893882D|nr:RDD family protein [Nocardia transvalensis]MBF6327448.1 RDD family protein [Nocardia transvalensis]